MGELIIGYKYIFVNITNLQFKGKIIIMSYGA